MIIDTATLDMAGFSEIRLRFYTAAMQCRHYEETLRADGERGSAKHYGKQADAHMRRVQVLNDLFEVNDVDRDYQESIKNEK